MHREKAFGCEMRKKRRKQTEKDEKRLWAEVELFNSIPQMRRLHVHSLPLSYSHNIKSPKPMRLKNSTKTKQLPILRGARLPLPFPLHLLRLSNSLSLSLPYSPHSLPYSPQPPPPCPSLPIFKSCNVQRQKGAQQ